jgi:hypothetical protein
MQHGRLGQYRWYLLDAVQLSTIALVALALVPGGAHALDMLGKLQLTPAEYLGVERLQHGWLLFVIAGALALAVIGLHAFLVRRNPVAFGWSIVALGSAAAAQIIFWSLAYPVNLATEGWTLLPVDFEGSRRQWEYALGAGGVLSFGALIAFVRAIEASRPIASMAILKSIEHDAAVRAARMRARPLDNGEEPLERATRAA